MLFSSPHARAGAGDLFASDPTANVIRFYALDGSTRVFAKGLNSPQGLTFDEFGNRGGASRQIHGIPRLHSAALHSAG